MSNLYDSVQVIHEENALINVKGNCSDGVAWIWDILDDCVISWEEKVSISLMIVSMIIWMGVIFPQLIKNCSDFKNTEGISVVFITLWFCGDAVNLIGSVVLHHTSIQVYVSIYFVVVDLIVLIQIAHHYLKQRQRIREIVEVNPPSSQIVLCLSVALVSFGGLLKYFGFSLINLRTHRIATTVGGRHLMSTDLRNNYGFLQNPRQQHVYLIGIISSLFYIGSRISQILKNFRRKSTEGLSMLLFCLAVLGNITYILGVFIRAGYEDFILSHLSWLMGSIIVSIFDAFIIFQFRYYGLRDFDTLSRQPLLDDGNPVVNS